MYICRISPVNAATRSFISSCSAACFRSSKTRSIACGSFVCTAVTSRVDGDMNVSRRDQDGHGSFRRHRRSGFIQHAIGAKGCRRQSEDDARLLVTCDDAMMPLEVVLEASVLLKPPECRVRKDEILGALPHQLLEVGNGSLASWRVETSVHPLRISREMPRPASSKLEQILVPLTHNNDRCAVWNSTLHNVSNIVDDPLVFPSSGGKNRLPQRGVLSSRATFAAQHFSEDLSEPLPDPLGIVEFHDAHPTLLRDPVPEGGLIDNAIDGCDERVRVIRHEHMLIRGKIQPFDANRRGHRRCGDHQRLNYLAFSAGPRADANLGTAGPVEGLSCPCEVRDERWDPSHHMHVRQPVGITAHGRSQVVADYRDGMARY